MSIQGQLLNPFWKTKICNFYLQGQCRNITDCNYAHLKRSQEILLVKHINQFKTSLNYKIRFIDYNYQTIMLNFKRTCWNMPKQSLIKLGKWNMHDEAKLLIFQKEIEQATFKIIEIIEKNIKKLQVKLRNRLRSLKQNFQLLLKTPRRYRKK
ncbi:unnamed protein product (macronuclear) [Paramecium tetraurelia]|uniref:C3H1-type domain-containing protein n=1 Tax=Paramecium tetraurelia TaxID=5888 RepID=A0CN69_PARTE|nr:uncharacterized protein GSPATT00008677001 [Paramecium tetraurelia]CAK72236.1 unnamed protein product [Paramecium tetraurelia]|eukprot:XP_001439633.1 hypothetical protein (macronuclear) [Paramecium tetraurelia strain d4-2]